MNENEVKEVLLTAQRKVRIMKDTGLPRPSTDNKEPVIEFQRSAIAAQLLAAMLSRETHPAMSDANICRMAVNLADTLLQVLDES